MADGKIYITISDKRGSGGDDIIPGVPAPSRESNDKDSFSLATYAGTQLLNSLKANAKKTISYTINNIGNFTGDYRLQKDVEEAVQLGSILFGVGQSFLAGMIATGGNPIGGLVAASVNIIGQGVNYALQENSALFAIKQQNYEISQIRNLSGLNTLKDESRGTEN